MRMRKHFATGAALAAAAALVLTACGGGHRPAALGGHKRYSARWRCLRDHRLRADHYLGTRHGHELAGPRGLSTGSIWPTFSVSLLAAGDP